MPDRDLMQHPVYSKVVTMLWQDQGLPPPQEFLWWGDNWDLGVAEGWLKTLGEYQLETFAIGDQQEMEAMIKDAKDTEGAEAAHRVLDMLFLRLLGG